MDKNELDKKIDAVIYSIQKRIDSFTQKLEEFSSELKNQEKLKEENIVKYQYELEKYHYKVLEFENEIKRCQMYIRRCQIYKDYLSSLESNNIFQIKKCEYELIKNIQDETIFYYDSSILKLKQKNRLLKMSNKKETIIEEYNKLVNSKEKNLKIFMNRDFTFEEEKIYSTEYLNYDVVSVAKELYHPNSKKHVS